VPRCRTNRSTDQRGQAEFNKSKNFLPLQELTGIAYAEEAGIHYRSLLYWRGAVPSREGQAAISEEVIEAEEARGFRERGCFRRKMAYYRDGLVLGSSEFVAEMLEIARESGFYGRRKHPVRNRGPQCCMRAYLTKS